MTKKPLFSVLVAVLLVFGAVATATAKQGFYLGMGLPYNTIGGDFDGSSGLQGGNDIILQPKIDGAFGLAVMGGYRITPHWAVELDAIGSSHDGKWGQMTERVQYFSFSVNGKYYVGASQTTQPYFLLGISGNLLVVKDGSKDTLSGAVDDGTFSGAGVNVGTGVDEYVGQNVTVSLGALYRYVGYTDAQGVNTSGSIDKTVNGSGFTLLLSTAYHF
jgi:opacity protein-like surface antigen